MDTKCVLKEGVKKRLLKDQELIGKLAKATNKQVQTVYRQLVGNSPALTTALSMDAIRTILEMKPSDIIHTRIQVKK